MKEASEVTNVKVQSEIINNPNRTAANYHWCTDLSIFDGLILTKGNTIKKEVFCYETRENFNSIRDASKIKQLDFSALSKSLNIYSRTAGGFHWCTNLSIFDNIDLSSNNNKPIYCYETKEKFNSIREATVKYNLKNSISICMVTNNPNKTAANYHWCTNLSIFDGVKLTSYKDLEYSISSYEREIVEFLRLNNITNIITSDRNILSGKELDIYLPDYNLAIEFNGDYWHSVEVLYKRYENPVNYHQDKVMLCLELGIDLISIFEFQWNENKELYKNYILDKINGIDRPDLELDENNNHNLQFCNKKYFTESYKILEPQLMNNKFIIYDCGTITYLK